LFDFGFGGVLSGVAAGLLMPASMGDACVVLVIVASADPDVSSVDAEAVLSDLSAISVEGVLLCDFAGDCSSLSDSFLAGSFVAVPACAMCVSAVAVLCEDACVVVTVSNVCTDFGAACALDFGCGCGQAAASVVFNGQAATLPVVAALVLAAGFGCGSFFGAMWIAGFSLLDSDLCNYHEMSTII
jgi:hypothetical protein